MMQLNEPCNALKRSGLIDWVNCMLCNGRAHKKFAILSETEARSIAGFICSRRSLVNTTPQCHDYNFRPDTLFISGVGHLKRVPKKSRIPPAEHLVPKTIDFRGIPLNIDL